jgi:hypothetical protein
LLEKQLEKMKQPQTVLGVTVVTLGILSVIPTLCATEPPDGDANSNATAEPLALDTGARISLPLQTIQTNENFSLGAVTESSGGEESESELNRKLTNPVSSIWSISNQFNNFELTMATGTTTGISSL